MLQRFTLSFQKMRPVVSIVLVSLYYFYECPGYDTKQSDSEVPGMLELWGMQSTLSLQLLPSPLWPGMVAPDWPLSMGYAKLNCLKWNCYYNCLNKLISLK